MAERRPLILASGSRARREMLANAGLALEAVPAVGVDETAIREQLRWGNPFYPAADIAIALARAKAREVSARRPEALVIGADQLLVHDGRLFEKPKNIAEARTHLLELRGRTHELLSGAVLVADGEVVWSDVTHARLRMRAFSGTFLDAYLARAGARVTETVGAYQLEGLGLQLFEAIDGDYFTILGLPLLPLLTELRNRGEIET
jgi:septum formation protein